MGVQKVSVPYNAYVWVSRAFGLAKSYSFKNYRYIFWIFLNEIYTSVDVIVPECV
jgi:hypothetical protein